MTPEDRNVARIRELYGLYAQGQIEPVLAALDESVCWRSVGPTGYLPWCGECTGQDGVRRYFEAVRDSVTVETYEPQYFVAQGDRVVAVIRLRVRDNATGRAETIDKVDIFRIRDGKIREFTEFGDMAAVAALR
jgi:ketosteroid isomerase-like protein